MPLTINERWQPAPLPVLRTTVMRNNHLPRPQKWQKQGGTKSALPCRGFDRPQSDRHTSRRLPMHSKARPHRHIRQGPTSNTPRGMDRMLRNEAVAPRETLSLVDGMVIVVGMVVGIGIFATPVCGGAVRRQQRQLFGPVASGRHPDPDWRALLCRACHRFSPCRRRVSLSVPRLWPRHRADVRLGPLHASSKPAQSPWWRLSMVTMHRR